MNPDFWRGRRVFLTGHTGFKGSWLALWLNELGAEVCGYALPPVGEANLYDLAGVGATLRSHFGDIRDLDALRRCMTEARPEIVIHLAAQALVRASYADPVGTIATNVTGTAHVLEAMRACPDVRAAVIVTTDKCYENREWLWSYRENEPLGGHDPYSASKAAAEIVTAAYRSSFFPPSAYDRHGVAIASARAGNVIGGGDRAVDRLVPDLVTAFVAGKPAVLRNPLATRPWQHVLEPLAGYLTLAEALVGRGPEVGEAWNFGPDIGDVRSVAEVAEGLARRWGQSPAWLQDGSSQPHEAQSLSLDSSKARHRLGWTPRWNLERALDATGSWYRAHQQGGDPARLTRQQIHEWLSAS